MTARRVCCASVLAFFLVSASVAGAATWSAENMAIPQTAQGQLFSLSCTAKSACEGVGQVVDAQGYTRALAEGWNGSSWKTQSAPSIDGPLTSLSAVSCSGPSSCIAVGSYQGNTTGGMLAERWDGSSWTVQFLTNPSGATGVLNSVSCATSQACTAVGFQFNNRTGRQLSLVEVWNGFGWHAQPTPTPSGAVGAELTSVSCTSPTACTAVGSYFGRNGLPLPMAGSRATASWQLEAVPVPAGALVTSPNSVSCSAADACTLVGTYLTNNQQLGLADRWNGFAWAQQTVPAPAGKPFVDLAGVSCPSASACTAVGGAGSQTSSRPLAEAWNGSGWKVKSTPAQPGGFLGAVSCAAIDSCNAVGVPGLAAAPAAPSRSSAGSLPRPGLLGDAPRVSSLGAAAAAKYASHAHRAGLLSGAAAAAGIEGQPRSPAMYHAQATISQLAAAASRPSSSLTLAEHWNGTSWTVQPNPGFTGAALAQAIGISCGSPTACFATGLYIDNSTGAELPLLERYDGTNWRLQTAPAPAGALATRLFDVSCTAANACTAVGESFTATTAIGFADRWDGTKWTLQRVAGQTGLGSALGSVSCTAANACTAVGALLSVLTGTESTLAEFWNGSTWTIQPTANKSGNYSSYLYGVSCNAVSACIAVGGWNSNVSLAAGALSEVWSGTSWQLKRLPALPNASFTLPDPVSCSAANACTAVGSWFSQTAAGAFADSWNGTAWAAQRLPTSLFALEGVSCLTTTACLATGGGTSAVWNGTSWAVQPLAPPPVGNSPDLQGVSCSAATADCMGVGSAFTGQPVPLAEGYS